jgi:hypothetical protein
VNRRSGLTRLDLGIVLGLAALVAALSLPNLAAQRKWQNESHALRTLRAISTAESVFRESDKENDGNLDYGTLTELVEAGLVPSELASGELEGYRFQVGYSLTTSEFLWFATAEPLIPGATGERYFCTNQSGVNYYGATAPFELDLASCQAPARAVPG